MPRVANVPLKAMAVSLTDLRRAVNRGDTASFRKNGGIRAPPHRAAEVAAFLAHFKLVAPRPLRHQRDEPMAPAARVRPAPTVRGPPNARPFHERPQNAA